MFCENECLKVFSQLWGNAWKIGLLLPKGPQVGEKFWLTRWNKKKGFHV
jgi:hypothetical protein